MKYEESPVLELKEQINAVSKKRLSPLPIRTVERYWWAWPGMALLQA